jgi:hypothetical protein
MNYFKVIFNSEQKKILEENNILINKNERFYLFDETKSIPAHGVPRRYDVDDFKYEGTSWKTLLIDFGNWFIQKRECNYNYVDIKNRFQKKIFSIEMETNFAGPLDNGLYINNNLGVNSWQQIIIDLLTIINIKDKGVIVVHYPFQRERVEIGKMFWLKEANMFYRYLLGLGYSKEMALNHIDILKKLCLIYKEGKKIINSWYGGATYVSNSYFLTADSKHDLSNAISKIKTLSGYIDEYQSTIENIIDFKNELYFEDKNYCSKIKGN